MQYSRLALRFQFSCLIFSPAFKAAGVYHTFWFREMYSRFGARYYTWTFIICDPLSLILVSFPFLVFGKYLRYGERGINIVM